MNISRLLKIAVIGSACALLAACEPSDGDIKSAIDKQLAAEHRDMQQLMGETATAPRAVKEVKKIGCKEDGTNAYKCDLEVVIASANGSGVQKVSRPARFVKGSEGWTMQ